MNRNNRYICYKFFQVFGIISSHPVYNFNAQWKDLDRNFIEAKTI